MVHGDMFAQVAARREPRPSPCAHVSSRPCFEMSSRSSACARWATRAQPATLRVLPPAMRETTSRRTGAGTEHRLSDLDGETIRSCSLFRLATAPSRRAELKEAPRGLLFLQEQRGASGDAGEAAPALGFVVLLLMSRSNGHDDRVTRSLSASETRVWLKAHGSRTPGRRSAACALAALPSDSRCSKYGVMARSISTSRCLRTGGVGLSPRRRSAGPRQLRSVLVLRHVDRTVHTSC